MFNQLYRLIRPILFLFDAETVHHFSLQALKWAYKLGLLSRLQAKAKNSTNKPVQVLGLRFPNPVGLAAGLDKNGDYLAPLAALGFGFIEVGTVTPRPQIGNSKPRLFRLPKHKAIINRMGFNNKGVDYLVRQVQAYRAQHAANPCIIGINIGKNKDTELDKAQDDYCLCMQKVYPLADYIVINISSPNTPGLRRLQSHEFLTELLQALKHEQEALRLRYQKTVPLVLKVDSDMNAELQQVIAELVLQYQFDGLSLSNTTVKREKVQGAPRALEPGGLSGAPLTEQSTKALAEFDKLTKGQIPLIGIGGIMCAEDALAKREAGASLVQLYSGLIYSGPGLIQSIVKTW